MIIIQLKNRIFCLDEKQFKVEQPRPATEEIGEPVYTSWDEFVNRIESYPDITTQVIYYNGRFLHNTAKWFGGPNDFILMPNEKKGIDFINEQLSEIGVCTLSRRSENE